MSSLRFRSAGAADADAVARLHADSWRRHYRGAYADAFLDGDIDADRRTVWSARLAAPHGTDTILAEQDGQLAGFVHVVLDNDLTWGSLVDNLHVRSDLRRTGIGRRLLADTARSVIEHASGRAVFLWVLEQNTAAQEFYRSRGGVNVEIADVPAPGGDPARLAGRPRGLRMTWPDAAQLTDLSSPSPGPAPRSSVSLAEVSRGTRRS